MQPFFDEDYFVQAYFPKREFGILGACVFGICLLTIVGAFSAVILIRNPSNFDSAENFQHGDIQSISN